MNSYVLRKITVPKVAVPNLSLPVMETFLQQQIIRYAAKEIPGFMGVDQLLRARHSGGGKVDLDVTVRVRNIASGAVGPENNYKGPLDNMFE